MSITGKGTRRSWILALLLLAVFISALAFLGGSSKPPNINIAFKGQSADGKESLFTIMNASPLLVHLVAHQIGASFTHRQAETISPGQSITVSVPLPADPAKNQNVSANTTSPPPVAATIRFHFRRQDTALEEGREMLDSVFSSIGLRIRRLNPDSSQNEFQVDYRLPAAAVSNP